MVEEVKKGLRHHIVAGARDVIVLFTLLSTLGGLAAWSTRPIWQPLSEIPYNIEKLKSDVTVLTDIIAVRLEPLIVEFDGHGQIIRNRIVSPGGEITVLFYLRRNVDCATTVYPKFFNVDTGLTYTGPTFDANRAPVTEGFIPFRVTVRVPTDLPDGFYTYIPAIEPLNCGVYGPVGVIPSDVFEVKRGT
jgi:hypothetical protein